MTVKAAPFRDPVQEDGQITRSWKQFFSRIVKELNIERGFGPSALKSYTVATVPTASDFINAMIFVSDEAGGAVPAFSDGSDWRRVTDRAVVS